ncbi:hypothetical protein E1287_15255 [Actinomadura sp. KC06]|uniref:hypothetical protein n=1 Tax=Actinomadura sp. KC06 TaxID=2530369 RepID=UPI0010470CFA|nr:hypothetical protein [Actinomadura sp. KC06]TDD34977.1 hypothetical protein E1287_15255 [Actinomadura sp. KC06]
MTYVMRDHPGWDTTGKAGLRAANTPTGDVVLLNAAESSSHGPAMDTYQPPARRPGTMPTALAEALTSIGAVGR